MVFTLEVEKEREQRSERVKSLDLHPTKPWILTGLYSGNLCIWNYKSQVMEKSIRITESPVRSAKFIARKEWLVVGSDDKFIYVHNHNTMEVVKAFEAHTDYIRCVVVHPTLPYVLSSSDDMLIKLWNWEQDWACARVFEGHKHYVMQVAFDRIAPHMTFASASLDCEIKMWGIESSTPSLTLEGHSKGINCVDFLVSGNKSFLITGSDDYTAKVWDYEAKTSVQTLEGHTNNVTSLCVHPEVPILITCSEDETIRLWNAITFRLEKTLNYELGRVWAVGCMTDSTQFVIGCDEGSTMAKMICSESWESLKKLQDEEKSSKE